MSCKQTHSKNPEHLLKSSGEHYRNMDALFNLVVSIEVSWVCHLCRSALPTRLFLPHQHANPLKTNMDNGSWMMNDSKLMDIYGGFGWFRCWMSYISSLFRNPHTRSVAPSNIHRDHLQLPFLLFALHVGTQQGLRETRVLQNAPREEDLKFCGFWQEEWGSQCW